MNILFIHQNFPGQFLHWSAHLAQESKHRVVALSMEGNSAPAGVQLRRYGWVRDPAVEIHPLLRELETQTLRAEACASAALKLKSEGFIPDVVIAHPGWGEALFIKDVFPQARLIVYCEFFYGIEGRDVGFDPEAPAFNFKKQCGLRMRNTVLLHSLDVADIAVSPTHWQKSTFPSWIQGKIKVIHDGIDYERLAFNPAARIILPANEHHEKLVFRPGSEVLTYVARNLEAVRGFHIFMRSLPEILRQRPEAHVVIVGGDGLSYGYAPSTGSNWRECMLAEVGSRMDMSRVHFVGQIPYETYVDLLHISKVHTYWTTPFVLSWSFLEAAASGAHIIASETPPVMEFAQKLGVKMVPFFDVERFSSEISLALSSKSKKSSKCHIDNLSKSRTSKLFESLIQV